MQDTLSQRLYGTRRGYIVQELFSNSAHFPIALIFLEMLLSGPAHYLGEIDFYAIILSCCVQAYFLGSRSYQKCPMPLPGNLIGPALYTLIEFGLEGAKFFEGPHHIAYWVFAFLIGTVQYARLHMRHPWCDYLVVLEHITRTFILIVMYAIFEHLQMPHEDEEYRSLTLFFADRSHLFITLALLFTGVILGMANYHAAVFLRLLRETGEQLKLYSEWLLGKQVLADAVEDPQSLSLARRERCVLFMDIRGFTAWSEAQPPEKVVAMLNEYFEVAESCWAKPEFMTEVIKVKMTGDEIMIVFTRLDVALEIMHCMEARINTCLQAYQLGAGTGIHVGDLVEGLLGSSKVKNYDIIGDTVNTAKRICDVAKAGETWLSDKAAAQLEKLPEEMRTVSVKGKTGPVVLYKMDFRRFTPSPQTLPPH